MRAISEFTLLAQKGKNNELKTSVFVLGVFSILGHRQKLLLLSSFKWLSEHENSLRPTDLSRSGLLPPSLGLCPLSSFVSVS